MAAPILWAPVIFGSAYRKTSMPIKFLVLRGGGIVFLVWGGEVPILSLWAWGFFEPKLHSANH